MWLYLPNVMTTPVCPSCTMKKPLTSQTAATMRATTAARAGAAHVRLETAAVAAAAPVAEQAVQALIEVAPQLVEIRRASFGFLPSWFCGCRLASRGPSEDRWRKLQTDFLVRIRRDAFL